MAGHAEDTWQPAWLLVRGLHSHLGNTARQFHRRSCRSSMACPKPAMRQLGHTADADNDSASALDCRRRLDSCCSGLSLCTQTIARDRYFRPSPWLAAMELGRIAADLNCRRPACIRHRQECLANDRPTNDLIGLCWPRRATDYHHAQASPPVYATGRNCSRNLGATYPSASAVSAYRVTALSRRVALRKMKCRVSPGSSHAIKDCRIRPGNDEE